jgi:hypothetical protein
MRRTIRLICCFAAVFLCGVRPGKAQQEVFHPGETYDSLQAGQEAHADAEAERRALIGRQIMIEEQTMRDNTWADPQDRYRPIHPESHGPVVPKAYGGPTLADVYAYPPVDGGPVYYAGRPGVAANHQVGGSSAPVPVFQPWPRVPNDIWGTPYYGHVRQPIGHVKIWTGRLSYIYKPIYASPPTAAATPAAVAAARPHPAATVPSVHSNRPSPTAVLNTPPPPPKPMLPAAEPPAKADVAPGNPLPPDQPKGGREI